MNYITILIKIRDKIQSNKLMKKIYKIISKLFKLILPFVDRMAYLKYHNQPFSNSPKLSKEKYYNLAKQAEINTYSIIDVDSLEKKCGCSINKNWLNSLALQTQIVVKNSPLNYAHGRVLYSVLRSYISTLKENIKTINILETGTARGFSALCMAKALSDSKVQGSIYTIDVLPHYTKMFWNSVADHNEGIQNRNNLLNEWSDLVERYIVFLQGYTKHLLPKIAFRRINFAFLDGSHTYKDVMFEFYNISQFQEKGDIIVFDDYNTKDFPGIVRAINQITNENKYTIKIVKNEKTFRDYAIAKKII